MRMNGQDCKKVRILLAINGQDSKDSMNFTCDKMAQIMQKCINFENIMIWRQIHNHGHLSQGIFAVAKFAWIFCPPKVRIFLAINGQDCRKVRILLAINDQDSDKNANVCDKWPRLQESANFTCDK